jgi:hypothetical protein
MYTHPMSSSSYDKFTAFQQVARLRLGDDVMQMVRREMQITRADLSAKYRELLDAVDDAGFHMEDCLDYLTRKMEDAKSHVQIIHRFCGPESESFDRAKKAFDDARQEFCDARTELRAEINRLKREARAVRAEYMAAA